MAWSYTGGKSRHSKWITPQLPEPLTYGTYVEVFGGAFWVYVNGIFPLVKDSDHQIIYNDANSFMANNWFCLSYKLEELREICENYPAHDKDLYDKIRDEVEAIDMETVDMGDVDLAAKHLYLDTQKFVGGPKRSLPKLVKGQKPKWQIFLDKLRNKQSMFERIDDVENLDFEAVIKKYDSPTTVFYVDPPYYATENYYEFGFTTDDHFRLAQCLKEIKGRFALSYYEFPELSQWFPKKEYYWYEHPALNAMAAKQGKKVQSKDVEVLVKNYNANEAISEWKRKLIEF